MFSVSFNRWMASGLICCLLSCQSPPAQKESLPASDVALGVAPDWAKDVVWYQIFVERFRNGDPANDPKPADLAGAYPGFVPDDWTITPWGHDWYKADSWFKHLEGRKDAGGNPIQSFAQKAQLRRYGGDLQGVLDQLDYLDSLGITAVYFNPLNDAPSLHKYDPAHWRHIDHNFGPTPQQDLNTMAAETPNDPATCQPRSSARLP
ncbi:MAG: alpha-amylase family glycosyl hydrolase, partial [Bacteroidota bacterium]